MSVYSGFVSRAQESSYNKALYNVLCLLQLKVAKSLRGEPFDDSLLEKYFVKFYQKVYMMDEVKYLQPHFSCAMKELATYYGVCEKAVAPRPKSISSNSSNLSFQQLQFNNSGLTDLDTISAETFPNRGPSPDSVRKIKQAKNYRQKTASIYAASSKKPSTRSKGQNPTVHNNNIIITINKSFNLGREPKPKVSGLPPKQRNNKPNFATQRVQLPRVNYRGSVTPTGDTAGLAKRLDDYRTEKANYSNLEVIKEGTQRRKLAPVINRPRPPRPNVLTQFKRYVPLVKRRGLS